MIVGIIMGTFGILTNETYSFNTLLLAIFAFMSLILMKTKYILFGYYFFLISCNILIDYSVYKLHSAYTGTLMIIILTFGC